MGYKMNGWSGYQSSPAKHKKGEQHSHVGPGKKYHTQEEFETKSEKYFDPRVVADAKASRKESPAKQVQGKILTPKSKKRSSEHEAVSVYKGTDKSEKIADLEDRIEFIKEDIFNSDEATPEQKKNLASLERELSIIRKTGE